VSPTSPLEAEPTGAAVEESLAWETAWAAAVEEREVALAAIERLEAERADGLIDELDYRALRAGYLARAAEAVRQVDRIEASRPGRAGAAAPDGGPTDGGTAEAAMADGAMADGATADGATADGDPADRASARVRPAPAAGRRRRGVLLGAAGLCLVVAVGILVGRFAGPELPGQFVTGSVQATPTQRLAMQLVQGRILVSEGKPVEALRLFDSILRTHPTQPEALAYSGWLMAEAGAAEHRAKLVATGRSRLSEAVAEDPTYPDAHLLLGDVLFRDLHDLADAVVQFKLFLADHPSPALVAEARPLIDAAFQAAGLRPLPAVASGHATGS
jgi:tetratricopeptide (TPR) repeat protein